MATIIPILIFMLILGVVIFIHELGHYLAARRAGIFVEEFALGMGPKIFGFNGKKKSMNGETTLYSLRAFPIGGFCKLRGMEDEVSDDPEAINNKPIKARILVMAGGALMNFLLAFVLLFFTFVILRGYLVIEIAEVNEGMPAYRAGIREGDNITHINGVRINEMEQELSAVINSAGESPVNFRVERGDQNFELSVIPVLTEIENDGGEIETRYLIGVTNMYTWQYVFWQRPGDAEAPYRRFGMVESFVYAGEAMFAQISAPFQLLAQLIVGEDLPEEAGIVGIVGIGDAVTDSYQRAIKSSVADMIIEMVLFTAMISAALGIMNLLPIPALDGARIIFLLIEAVRRKPVPPEKEAIVHFVGLVAIIALAIFITYKDIARIVESNATEIHDTAE
ncbi:MAG: site-2 protease family protein [Clostridiales bacterium]|jgi:regulator of sigma E protease|nr:site-2 protease family protein [Clostridiales bacterium]